MQSFKHDTFIKTDPSECHYFSPAFVRIIFSLDFPFYMHINRERDEFFKVLAKRVGIHTPVFRLY